MKYSLAFPVISHPTTHPASKASGVCQFLPLSNSPPQNCVFVIEENLQCGYLWLWYCLSFHWEASRGKCEDLLRKRGIALSRWVSGIHYAVHKKAAGSIPGHSIFIVYPGYGFDSHLGCLQEAPDGCTLSLSLPLSLSPSIFLSL